ncbi:MAG: NfeD family protein [Cyanobacteria bacterium P01_A01_bin.135]
MRLFPYEPTVELFPQTLSGEVVEQIACAGKGRIYFQATHWNARFHPSNTTALALPGSHLNVIGREGTTLLVEPEIVEVEPSTLVIQSAKADVN